MQSIGKFELEMAYNVFPKRGIVLSTGNVFHAVGPNNSTNTSSLSFEGKDFELSKLANGKIYDYTCLEFDFIPFSDSVSFRFFFASEEYPEYVGRNVNDIFAFFLTQPGSNFKKNLAVLPNSNTPVAIDNINNHRNNEYYLPSINWDYENIDKNKENNKPRLERAAFIQFDGMTTTFDVGSSVAPFERHHLKIALADVGDRLYDSGIFIEANSFRSKGKKGSMQQWAKQLMGKEIVRDAQIADSTVILNLMIQFEFSSSQLTGDSSYTYLDMLAKAMNMDNSFFLSIFGHTDTLGTKDFNMQLSINRAKAVAEYLNLKGVDANRLKYNGFGEAKPIDLENDSRNRRVEIVIERRE